MFREMRRKKQLLSEMETIRIFERGTSGTLALLGDEGYPYAVPMSYCYVNGKIFFHCAKSGHKIDAVRSCDKASFCVIDQDQIVPAEFTTYFRSAIAFGRVREIQDDGEKLAAITLLAEKYSPDYTEGRKAEIQREFNALCMLELRIEHMSGKEALELVRARE